MNDSTRLYKVVSAAEWQRAETSGVFSGSSIDHADGFIHLSAKHQVIETVAKHFAGQSDLVLVSIDGDALGESLRWEPSRDHALFPHVYGDISMSAVISVVPLPLGGDGTHQFPDAF